MNDRQLTRKRFIQAGFAALLLLATPTLTRDVAAESSLDQSAVVSGGVLQTNQKSPGGNPRLLLGTYYEGTYTNVYTSAPIRLTVKSVSDDGTVRLVIYVSRPPSGSPAPHHDHDIDVTGTLDGAQITFSVGPFAYWLTVTADTLEGDAIGGLPSKIVLNKIR